VTRLDPERRRRVLELAAAARAQPAGRDWSAMGCAGLVITVAGLTLVPSVAWLVGPGGGRIAVVVLGALALVSLLVGLLGTTLGLAPLHRRVEAAVEALAGPEGRAGDPPPDAALEAAVTLLVNAHHAPGPYTAEIFDAVDVARRLGPALPLVIAVEEVLLEEGAVYPVFTPVRPEDS
jgi:hypothetical protein